MPIDRITNYDGLIDFYIYSIYEYICMCVCVCRKIEAEKKTESKRYS